LIAARCNAEPPTGGFFRGEDAMTDATQVTDPSTVTPNTDTSTVSEEQADKDFEAGYSGTPSEAPAKPQETPPASTVAKPDTPAGDAKAPATAAVPDKGEAKPASTPTPEQSYAGKAEVDDVRNQLAAARDQITKMSGSLGVLHQALQTIKTTGQPVKVTKDLLKKLNDNGYGELADFLAEDLSGILTSSVVPGTSSFDATAFEKAVDEKVAGKLDEMNRGVEKKLLTMSHPDWGDIWKSADFKSWKATHPAHIQQELDNSWDSEFLSKGLTAFKKWRDEKAAKEAEKAASAAKEKDKRLEANLQPTPGAQHAGGRAPPSDDEAFEQGFKEGRAQA
jgi:hypothetical protein